MALKVLIWNTTEGKKGGLTGRPGHAALAITGLDHQVRGLGTTNVDTYVSWWPNDDRKATELSRRRGGIHNIYQDFAAEMSDTTRAGLDGSRGPAWRPNANQIGGQPNAQRINRESLRFDNKMGKPFQYDENQNEAARDNDPNTAMRSEWLQAPDHVIRIPTLDCAAGYRAEIGLSESDIKDWWQLYQTKTLKLWDLKISQNPGNIDAIETTWAPNHTYRMASRRFNCASVAMAGLLAGGAAKFVDPPKRWCWFTPNDVRDYAQELARVVKLNAQNAKTYLDHIQSIQQFEQNPRASQEFPTSVEELGLGDLQKKMLFGPQANQDNDQYRFFMDRDYNQTLRDQILNRYQFNQKHVQQAAAFQDPVWPVDVWRRESYVGKFARRKQQVQQIDRLLPRYHALNWAVQNDAIEKSRILLEIIRQIQDHIINKPRSDRRDAILTLGAQCLNVLRNRPYDPNAVPPGDPWNL